MSLGGSYGEGTSNQSYQNQGTSTTSADYTKTPLNSGQITDALGGAQSIFQNGNPMLQSGMSGINTGAANTGALYGASDPSLTSTLNGSYLSAGNPYFQQMVSQLGDAIRPQIDGQFEANGRYGSGASANAYASALATQAGNLAGSNYTNERQNQLSAASQLPSYTAGQLAPGQAQLSAGYLPIQQYIQALSALSPGQTGKSTSSTASTGSGTMQGSTTNWGVNASV
jgi:hypothetical protein